MFMKFKGTLFSQNLAKIAALEQHILFCEIPLTSLSIYGIICMVIRGTLSYPHSYQQFVDKINGGLDGHEFRQG